MPKLREISLNAGWAGQSGAKDGPSGNLSILALLAIQAGPRILRCVISLMLRKQRKNNFRLDQRMPCA